MLPVTIIANTSVASHILISSVPSPFLVLSLARARRRRKFFAEGKEDIGTGNTGNILLPHRGKKV